ncbi:hypothetical protein KHA93_14815 [Bacillus sp. FJAT-49732]|uniref:Uncharacterized protein n=1 Tax=Lederbergia citrisecunda TaxID=2833583 RepID=A0A942TMB1_9BACI|nr:hypothetical protein [Lederbergia citrisecunda]MBS4200906.1 hypothetical protein [Lederbergia citrisecunda]
MDNQEPQLFSHKQLAASCFNKVWNFLDKEDLSSEEKEEMIHLCHSSFWHWTQVQEHTKQNLSIGYWQLSRVYAVVGQGESALDYAKRCISIGLEASLEPFYIGYGYEAAARAYSVLQQSDNCQEMMNRAYEYVEKVTNIESKQLLLKDLNTVAN